MTVATDELTTVTLAVLECLRTQLAALDNPPANVMLRTGERTEALLSMFRDECCEGLGWVRPGAIYPSTNDFPNPDQGVSSCGPDRWAAQLELGVVRCAPTPDAQTLTSADEWNDATIQILADAAAMRRALYCLETAPAMQDRLWVAGPWTPTPTEGGCMGGTHLLTVAITC
jgi:hypothetical protein